MKRFLVVGVGISAVALGCGGCSHIPFLAHTHKKAEKQSSHIATATEQEFEGRWVDKRASELISQGESAESARARAQRDFYNTFPATTVAQQAR